MDDMGRTIPVSCLPGHILALRHSKSWSFDKDRGGNIAHEFLGPADHTTVLPSCSTYIRVAHLLLRLPVSFYNLLPCIAMTDRGI
jgi:hypothetical protein